MPGFDERDGIRKRCPAINRDRLRGLAKAGNNAGPFPIDDTVGCNPVDDEVLGRVGLQQRCRVVSSLVIQLFRPPTARDPSDSSHDAFIA